MAFVNGWTMLTPTSSMGRFRDFWKTQMSDWRMEEQQVKMTTESLNSAEADDRTLDAQKI